MFLVEREIQRDVVTKCRSCLLCSLFLCHGKNNKNSFLASWLLCGFMPDVVQVVYHGSTKDVLPHLASLGHKCPNNFNPADFMVRNKRSGRTDRHR